MFDELTGSAFTFLDDFITRMITSDFLTGDAPYIIDYSSTARFNPFSTVFLSEQQLDEALTIAFTGSNLDAYMERLKDLPSENVFFGAEVSFGSPEERVPQRSGGNKAAGIAAAAVAATLVAAGIVLYRQRQRSEEPEREDLVKKGDRTVAGETYTGDSYDGTASASGSLEHRSGYSDEEDAQSKSTADGTRPKWGATKKSSFDDDDDTCGSSFDQMALQGLVPQRQCDDQSESLSKRRPRTVEEIEAMLCTDHDDEASQDSRGNESASILSSSSQRPRTVEEIESLLSVSLDDDASASSSVRSSLK